LLSRSDYISDEDLQSIVIHNSHTLQTYCALNAHNKASESVVRILRSLPNLTNLQLGCVRNHLSATGLQIIASFPSLSVLHLKQFTPDLQPDELAILTKLPLQELCITGDVTGPNCISDEVLERLISGIPTLKTICFDDCRALTPMGMLKIFKQNSSLSLKSVSLKGCNVTDDLLVGISDSLTAITTLDVSRCPHLTERGLVALIGKHYDSLTHINVKASNNIDGSLLLGALTICKRLKSLNISREGGLQTAHTRSFGRALHLLEHISPDLEFLNSAWCGWTNDTLSAFVQTHPKLQWLNIAAAGQITDATVDLLVRHCQNIKMLSFEGCKKLSSACIYMVTQLQHLQNLNLARCNNWLTSKDIQLLSGIESLHFLDIQECKQIDNNIISSMHTRSSLHGINASNCNFTRVGKCLCALSDCQDSDKDYGDHRIAHNLFISCSSFSDNGFIEYEEKVWWK
jgi:hypothetical protein